MRKFPIFTLLTTYYLLLTTTVFAQSPSGIPIGDKFGFGNIKTMGEATSRLVDPAFSIAAVMVVIYLLSGAFQYLTSGGDKEAIDAARKKMTHAFVGFLILMMSFLAIKYLLFALFQITGFEIINRQ